MGATAARFAWLHRQITDMGWVLARAKSMDGVPSPWGVDYARARCEVDNNNGTLALHDEAGQELWRASPAPWSCHTQSESEGPHFFVGPGRSHTGEAPLSGFF